jgi:hypothetical protein
MKKISLYDLAFGYIKLFYMNTDISVSAKKEVIMDVVELLDKGWTAEELGSHIKNYYTANRGAMMDLKAYFRNLKPTKVNLLKPCNFYYHNELRITTPPPVVDFDYNTGELIRTVEDYYLEMKASYTIDELANYFLSKVGLCPGEAMTKNRIIGALQWLANNYDIDLILFMIDIADDIIVTNNLNKLRIPSDVKEYYAEAKELMNNKITECKVAGGDKIVPRKRVLSN